MVAGRCRVSIENADSARQSNGRPGFVPYVYGATLGTPSKGRPGKVADALRNVEVLPAALAAVPDLGPSAPGRLPSRRGGAV